MKKIQLKKSMLYTLADFCSTNVRIVAKKNTSEMDETTCKMVNQNG